MKFFKLLLSFLFLFSPLAVAKNQVVYYQPKFVELTGIIKYITFPGPPNYESIKNGDRKETGLYLILKNPVDVDFAPKIEKVDNDEPEKNLKIFQLVVYEDKDWEKLRKDNRYVRINGTLFHAITGYHNTRVLLETRKIAFLPSQKITATDLSITKEDCLFMAAGLDKELKLTLRMSNGQICSKPSESE